MVVSINSNQTIKYKILYQNSSGKDFDLSIIIHLFIFMIFIQIFWYNEGFKNWSEQL